MGSTIKYPVVVKDLDWNFGDNEVLKQVNIRIEKRKLYCIIGPNGSGKTTLLKNISKALETKKEKVFIDDTDLCDLKNRDIAKKLSCVPQSTNIDFEFTVMDIVLMGRSPYIKRFQSESTRDIEAARMAMESTNTWHLKDKSINSLSGGEKQRVIVARALAQETGIMLLDEPVSQLDIHHQVELMDNLRFLIEDKGITVMAILHDLNLAANFGDSLILLNEGRVVCQGSAEVVLTPENIEKVYRMRVKVIKNPVNGKPLVIPASEIQGIKTDMAVSL
jgi:iron complex transport system ATP-binding protein